MTLLIPRDYTILGLVRSNPGICRKNLAAIYGVRPESASVGTSLRILKERGYITNKRCAKTAFFVTDKGELVLEAVAVLEAIQ